MVDRNPAGEIAGSGGFDHLRQRRVERIGLGRSGARPGSCFVGLARQSRAVFECIPVGRNYALHGGDFRDALHSAGIDIGVATGQVAHRFGHLGQRAAHIAAGQQDQARDNADRQQESAEVGQQCRLRGPVGFLDHIGIGRFDSIRDRRHGALEGLETGVERRQLGFRRRHVARNGGLDDRAGLGDVGVQRLGDPIESIAHRGRQLELVLCQDGGPKGPAVVRHLGLGLIQHRRVGLLGRIHGPEHHTAQAIMQHVGGHVVPHRLHHRFGMPTGSGKLAGGPVAHAGQRQPEREDGDAQQTHDGTELERGWPWRLPTVDRWLGIRHWLCPLAPSQIGTSQICSGLVNKECTANERPV